MMVRSSGKPPLARSPIRLRPRRNPLHPVVRTPPGSLTKSQIPNHNWHVEESGLWPEYHTMSCELKALAKMVHQELGTTKISSFDDGGFLGERRIPLFERGRFYDEYCARRNERLKKRKGEFEGYEKKPTYDLGVRVESRTKKEGKKKSAVVAASTPVSERRAAQTPVYSWRRSTSQENKKPPSSISMATMNVEKSVGISERRIRSSRNA